MDEIVSQIRNMNITDLLELNREITGLLVSDSGRK